MSASLKSTSGRFLARPTPERRTETCLRAEQARTGWRHEGPCRFAEPSNMASTLYIMPDDGFRAQDAGVVALLSAKSRAARIAVPQGLAVGL